MGLDRRHGRHHFFALLAAALAIARSLKTFRTSAVAAAWLFVAGVGEAEGAFGVTPGDNDAIGAGDAGTGEGDPGAGDGDETGAGSEACRFGGDRALLGLFIMFANLFLKASAFSSFSDFATPTTPRALRPLLPRYAACSRFAHRILATASSSVCRFSYSSKGISQAGSSAIA